MIYNSYYIASGAGESDCSDINAFDEALFNAGICDLNLVKVSSILPENPTELKEKPDFALGEVVHCVLARLDGKKGEQLAAGLGWAIGQRPDGRQYGFVMEAEGNVSQSELENDLSRRLDDMAKRRDFLIKEKQVKVSYIPRVEKENGCALVALVYRKI